MSNRLGSEREDTAHLAGLSDGAGCTEIWEHLSHNRDVSDSPQQSD
jgi:hypothetical protein